MTHARSATMLLAAAALLGLTGCVKSRPQPASMGATGDVRQNSAKAEAPDAVALSAIREKALSTVRELATSETPQFRANAVEAAAETPDRLRSIIEAGLHDKNAGVRAVSAMAVGHKKISKLVYTVQPLTHDSNAYVQSAAIFALLRCGVSVDRSPLATLLLKDPSPQVRSQVAYILGELGDPSAIPLLKSALKSRAPTARPEQTRVFELQVAEALIKLGDQDQRGAVRAALFPSRQEELETTALACQILGEVEDRESVHQLISLSEYRDESGHSHPPEVQLAIAGALAVMGHRDGTFVADQYAAHKSPLVRAQAAYVYGEIAKVENWGKLDAMMGDSYPGVRIAAAAAILKSAQNAHQE